MVSLRLTRSGCREIRNLHLLAPDRLQYEEIDRTTTVIRTEGGKFRPWSSVRTDGTVVMKDGKFANGSPTLEFERCGR